LDRIDQRTLPLDGRFVPPGDGTGVHAYVIDTGVRRTHRELAGRVDWIGDFTTGTGDRLGTDNADDCDPGSSPERGHGTHVASILAGRTFGVARAVHIHALRILPCTGTTRTDFVAAVRAVDWITAHGSKPAVVNISPARFETPDRALDAAIGRSILAGYVYVLSAGGVPTRHNGSRQPSPWDRQTRPTPRYRATMGRTSRSSHLAAGFGAPATVRIRRNSPVMATHMPRRSSQVLRRCIFSVILRPLRRK
jgi:hypothetical protein